MFEKKSRNLMTWEEILEEEFIISHSSLLDSIAMQVVVALNLKISFLCKSITEIVTDSMPWIFMFPVTLKNYKLPFKLWKYYFNVVGIRSCVPQSGHSFACYRDSNNKIISLLGWKRFMELECYIAAKRLSRVLPLCANAGELRTVELPIKKEKGRYHLIAVHNVFPDEPVGLDSKEILSYTSKTREFLASLFNKEGEKESNLHCSAGRIDFKKLMDINHQYMNPPSEP